jgi:hypothetical protein
MAKSKVQKSTTERPPAGRDRAFATLREAFVSGRNRLRAELEAAGPDRIEACRRALFVSEMLLEHVERCGPQPLRAE